MVTHARLVTLVAVALSCKTVLSAGLASSLPSAPTITKPTSASGTVFADHAVDFSSALQIEASIRREWSQTSNVPALPIPTDGGNKAVAKLAAGPLPPVQVTSERHDTKKIVQGILAEADQVVSTKDKLVGRQSSKRIMIVGDSISHGQQGDFTWRYRLWQWLRSQNVNFQFVGPYTGTFQSTTALATGPQSPPQPPPLYDGSGQSPISSSQPTNNFNGGYARSEDSAFTSNGQDAHFSVWGRTLAVDKGLIQNVLQNNPADMILLELGFNDMGFFVSDSYGTINSLQTFITNARSVNPNVQFAVANVPQRTYIRNDLTTNISTYNQILPGYLQKWSTPQSPIQLADFEGNYQCATTGCPAGYDGLHPNAWGEYQIAQAFSKALIAGYGIGSTPITIPAQSDPSLVRSIDMPTNFKVFTSPQGVSATWDAVYGAYSYNVDVHVNGGGGLFSAGSSAVNRWDCQWSLPGFQYSVRVQAACGDQTGPWTEVQMATAQPQLAPPPNNIVVTPTSDGFEVTWDPPTGDYTNNIVEYNIIYWDSTPSDCNFITGAAFKNSPARITGLLTGKSYLVAPVTWNSNGQGLPHIGNNVVPGMGTPPVPSNLQAVSNDATSVHLSWTGSQGAGAYEVFVRNATGGAYKSLGNTSQTCLDDYFLYPGTTTYEFCVAAYNGDEGSAQGPGVIPPSPSKSAATQTCGPAPSWCPGFFAPYSGPSVGGCAGCGGNGCPSGSSSCVGPTSSGGSGSVTTIGGKTVTTTNSNGQTVTTVTGGTTSTIGVTSPTSPGSSSPSVTVIHGTTITTTNSNGMTVVTTVGGSTSTLPPSSSQTSSSTTTSAGAFPVITAGLGTCTGPDCDGSKCTGILCAVFGCTGSGCVNGRCNRSSDCRPRGCTGPNCVNGMCQGSGCVTKGCTGPDCRSSDGHCTGVNCISIGCAGGDCPGANDNTGICIGPECSEETCGGLDCVDGGCTGPSCTTYGTDQGGGADAPADNPDDGCGENGDGVTMAPSCDVTCTTASATQTCTTNCQTTTGCSVTPTTSTTTLSSDQFVIPSAIFDYYSDGAQGDAFLSSQAVMGMSYEASVDASTTTTMMTSPSPTPTPTPSSSPTPTQPPYPTFSADGPRQPYCYSSMSQSYIAFNIASASSALTSLCNAGHTLQPSQASSFIATYGSHPAVTAAVGWAPNQSNCPPEQQLPLSGQECYSFFTPITENCGNPGTYEGGYIANSGSNGCIEFTIGSPIDTE